MCPDSAPATRYRARGQSINKALVSAWHKRLGDYTKVVTLLLIMGNGFWDYRRKELFEREQARECARELASCLVHEAFKKIETTERGAQSRNVFLAFAYLGRAKTILRDRFEEVRRKLYEKAKERLLAPDFSEEELKRVVEEGLSRGLNIQLPIEMGNHAFHYGFVAEMFSLETYDHHIGYSKEYGWADILGHVYEQERGLKDYIYILMREKINTWREWLPEIGSSVRGVGGWLEKLEKNINDPDWLSKVEDLLLRVAYFGVEIDSDDA